jgi:serine/threonine protein kinase
MSAKSRFIKQEVLGKGGYGEVWKATDPITGNILALKTVIK